MQHLPPPQGPRDAGQGAAETAPPPGRADAPGLETAFGQPRNSLSNRFVYAVISQRARGLSIGVNLTPDKHCNFDCVYCEVNRDEPGRDQQVDLPVLAAELEGLLRVVAAGKLRGYACFKNLPAELLELKEVALSGDGEPTLCPNFAEVVAEVLRIRVSGRFPAFKIVLITNATTLDQPDVMRGVRLLDSQDEIWAKVDAGTQAHLDRINRSEVSLSHVLGNILTLAKRRPVVIQSLFPLMRREGPSMEEIDAYVGRLRELKEAGAQISMVQVYSAHRPPHRPECAHLPLRQLSLIAKRVWEGTGLRAEVF